MSGDRHKAASKDKARALPSTRQRPEAFGNHLDFKGSAFDGVTRQRPAPGLFSRRWGAAGRVVCLALLALGASGSAAGARPTPASDVAQSALCTAAVQEADRHHTLPSGLLGTIAKVESGRPIAPTGDIRAWPWTINADGTGLFFDSRAEAVAWAERGLASGVHLMDVGCMQVNLQFHPGAFRSLDEAFDPTANVAYAARFLQQLGTETNGDWNLATGFYHSHTPGLAADYRSRVAEMGAGILSGIGAPEPLYLRALRQGTLRLAMAGGGVLTVNIHRQPSARPQRRRSACEVANLLAPLLHAPPRVTGCRIGAPRT
jgi:hypothetical protein